MVEKTQHDNNKEPGYSVIIKMHSPQSTKAIDYKRGSKNSMFPRQVQILWSQKLPKSASGKRSPNITKYRSGQVNL